VCISVGKTTLADALLASNGIISQRLAGKVNTSKLTALLFVKTYSEQMQNASEMMIL